MNEDIMTGLMAGKRGLIMGLANDKSLAWGIAKRLHAEGAELAFSYQGEVMVTLAALNTAGWPEKADPDRIVAWQLLLAVMAIGLLSGWTYAPIAAMLVEMFPARVRYTSMSVPYHIGTGYFGGFLPVISQYIVVSTGDVFAGLWYTIVVVAVGLVIMLLFLKDSRHININD
jgi:MFS family permease